MERYPDRVADAIFFVALLSTALALGGALAHLLEMPNKMQLTREQYFTVQAIYAGWNRLAYLLAVQFLSLAGAIIVSYRTPGVAGWTILAMLFLIAAQTVFWIYTYPANVATINWSVVPGDWEAWRRQWEYSHAVGAGLQIGAMASISAAAVARTRAAAALARSTRGEPDQDFGTTPQATRPPPPPSSGVSE